MGGSKDHSFRLVIAICIFIVFYTFYCFFVLDGKNISKCQYDQLVVLSQPEIDDMFTPQCNQDGSYKPIQCYEKKNVGKWCWCVDENGLEIIGSKVENTDDAGNLTAEKCDGLRRQNTSEDYWLAYYRHTSTTPTPAMSTATTPKPTLEIGGNQMPSKSCLLYFI